MRPASTADGYDAATGLPASLWVDAAANDASLSASRGADSATATDDHRVHGGAGKAVCGPDEDGRVPQGREGPGNRHAAPDHSGRPASRVLLRHQHRPPVAEG